MARTRRTNSVGPLSSSRSSTAAQSRSPNRATNRAAPSVSTATLRTLSSGKEPVIGFGTDEDGVYLLDHQSGETYRESRWITPTSVDCPEPTGGELPVPLTVSRVVIEVDGHLSDKPYPKSAKGRRTVPLAPFLQEALRRHRDVVPHEPDDLVLTNHEGGSMLRSNFRRQVWRPSLVRAGLLGQVLHLDDAGYRAVWPDRQGQEHSMDLPSYRDAVNEVATRAAGRLRFHDLRHCYATWLVTSGVPVNVVQAVMGHEQASTTLNRYAHSG